MKKELQNFWALPAAELLNLMGGSAPGLTSTEAEARLRQYGANLLKPRKRTDAFTLLLSQFKSPLVLILLVAAIADFVLGDRTNPEIILAIVIVSGLLGFWQEYSAAGAVERLIAMVQVKVNVLRDGKPVDIPVEKVVPGDITVLNAGDLIPGDCLIVESKDLFINEAILTGETFPVEKEAGVLAADTPMARRSNSLYMGTHVVSGTANALVIATGKDTEFGKVSEHLKLRPPETEFEHGVRRFGGLLVQATIGLVVAIFIINLIFQRPLLPSFLFAAALAVGLTPQLLPAIISVNLAQGARKMAEKKVIVRRLSSVENFGSMNVLCSDKTGTLTEGVVRVRYACNINAEENERALFFAYLNSYFETGFSNPIDEAIRAFCHPDISGYKKLDEIPYDFIRKRLSILLEKDGKRTLITKGALAKVLEVCTEAETSEGKIVDIAVVRADIESKFEELSRQGYRLLGIAYRDTGDDSLINAGHEANMTFLGFVILHDPPKKGIIEVIENLKKMGVSLKIVTGDNRLVTQTVCTEVGILNPRVLAASDLEKMSDEALLRQVNSIDAFAEVEPNEKERIILALKKAGNVAGYIGDGINDASALHAADVGISVDNAVDVAKEAADIVLLEKDLEVLLGGVQAGRTTFANTLKYVFMAASANFGNMFSMAGASLFLPFLPLLPIQILLINLLTDLPEMAIATDSVDPELLQKPRRWDIKFIRNFMLTFGLLSSVFDFFTFGVLLLVLHAGMQEFRAGWFVESIISACIIVLVVRTRRPFFKSRPGKYLILLTLLVSAAALAFPYLPVGRFFNFEFLPLWYIPVVLGIVVLYIGGAELTKYIFYKKVKF